MMDQRQNCYIINNIVTNICVKTQNNVVCDMPVDIKEVPSHHRVISGCFTVTRFTTMNVIMANWSTQIWQNILNRVMRSLSSAAFSTNFIGATVMIACDNTAFCVVRLE
ncbi:hypothetical protein DICVIV_14018 [Dictyocaulus viviparus]|uniref:Uncharacterized protein n=1 Tax=Dictyocaulus viviparus TaxID=29172 RepID=A0A0D8X8G2_DICVI|nr:hypothetical protein DICVIV_14018 [Dictyocaulus viviparus]